MVSDCSARGAPANGVLVSLSVGMPKMNFGRMCAPRRMARYVAAASRDASTAMSVAELPMPSTTTRLPWRTSGVR